MFVIKWIFFSDNTRVRIFIFFPEFNIKFHDKNSESDYYFFPPRKSEYFIQQHWESEYFLEKKHKGDMFRSCVLSYIQYIFLYCEQSFSLFKCIKCSSIVTKPKFAWTYFSTGNPVSGVISGLFQQSDSFRIWYVIYTFFTNDIDQMF